MGGDIVAVSRGPPLGNALGGSAELCLPGVTMVHCAHILYFHDIPIARAIASASAISSTRAVHTRVGGVFGVPGGRPIS
jgi:hypothetical protein